MKKSISLVNGEVGTFKVDGQFTVGNFNGITSVHSDDPLIHVFTDNNASGEISPLKLVNKFEGALINRQLSYEIEATIREITLSLEYKGLAHIHFPYYTNGVSETDLTYLFDSIKAIHLLTDMHRQCIRREND
jgi:hypothetical protein